MNVLVTGGAGFIGSKLALACLARGWQVHVWDDLSTGCATNLTADFIFKKIDLSDEREIRKMPGVNFDIVFHLAGQSSGELSFSDPDNDFMRNAAGTKNLVQYSIENNVRRFVFSSSMAVYGDAVQQPLDETQQCFPKSYYAASKLAAESYCNLLSSFGVDVTVMRLFSVYGPGQDLSNLHQGMVSIYLAYLLKGSKILVKGSLRRYRDFVYVDDVVRGFMATVDRPFQQGFDVFNFGSGKKTEVRLLIETMLRLTGHKKNYFREISQTPGDQLGAYADMSKFGSLYGWTPSVEIEEGLGLMVGSYRTKASLKL